MEPERPQISIVVTNWNGEPWLARCLSSLQISARAAKRSFELIVVDDASEDGSVALIRERFPSVRLLRNKQNLGFGRATMRGGRAARGEVLVLCNNDLAAQEPFIGNLTRWFEKDEIELNGQGRWPRSSLFAVSARTLNWYDGAPNQLCMNAVWKGGRLNPAWSAPEKPTPCVFVQAGAAAYDRRAFLKLGGLQPLFEPGYFEDYDLSWYAMKRGFINIYDPDAVALHHGGGSMTRRFGAEGVARLRARNQLLFEWTNLRDGRLLAEHCARLPLALAREWSGRGPVRLTVALTDAVSLFSRVVRLRMRRRGGLPDQKLLRYGRSSRPSF